jgi:predicted membrane channel-forming protein YqfA (hemolysin III family)
MTKISNKFYIISFIILFGISTAILLIASTATTPVPAWGGCLDVGIVVLIACTGITIHQQNKSAPRYDISHMVAIYLFPLILVGMWLYQNSIDFNILLPGLAWRTYFFLSILPHGLNLWKFEQPQ